MRQPIGRRRFLALAGSGFAAACSGSKTSSSSTASPAAASTKTPAYEEQEVSFVVGPDTLYGTLLLPGHAPGKTPAALIIAGSGPTDRNGNSPLVNGRVDNLAEFARAIGAAGVASLRYDKLGTGKTGLGSFASHPQDIGFDTYDAEAEAAFDYLRSRPEVDPGRVLILGHSEGGLFALNIAATRGPNAGPKALVLAAAMGFPYLATVRRQLSDQYAAAVSGGSISRAAADGVLADFDRIANNLRSQGAYPPGFTPPEAALKTLFTPDNERFWAGVANLDPAVLAARVPTSTPVLILQGDKDSQVLPADAQSLYSAFRKAGNTNAQLAEIPDADHVFKQVTGTPDPASDYTNPALPFSRDAEDVLAAFAKTALK